MRIISGQFKGRKIVAPKKLPVRPTTDMAKESLFNILNNYYYFDEISVLDLFSGTGNISYEFASRGTENITAIDGDFGCVRFIKQTAEQFKMPIDALKADVFKYLENARGQYTVIFADPPYNLPIEEFSKIPTYIFEKDLLEKEGLLIVEHSKHTSLDHIDNFSFKKSYGGNTFSFFEWPKAE